MQVVWLLFGGIWWCCLRSDREPQHTSRTRCALAPPKGVHPLNHLSPFSCCCCCPSLPPFLCLVYLHTTTHADNISLDHPNPTTTRRATATNPTGGAGEADKAAGQQPGQRPLADDIHPPPTILNIDLVRMLERHLARDALPPLRNSNAAAAAAADNSNDKAMGGGGDAAAAAAGGGACSAGVEGGAAAQHEMRGAAGCRRDSFVPDIGPNRTTHLQMTPMVSLVVGLLVGCPATFACFVYIACAWCLIIILADCLMQGSCVVAET